MSGKVREFDHDWRVATLQITCSYQMTNYTMYGRKKKILKWQWNCARCPLIMNAGECSYKFITVICQFWMFSVVFT